MVHLADALEVPDVEAVEGDELARIAGVVTEPERFGLEHRLGDEPAGHGADGRRPRAMRYAHVPNPWRTKTACTVDFETP